MTPSTEPSPAAPPAPDAAPQQLVLPPALQQKPHQWRLRKDGKGVEPRPRFRTTKHRGRARGAFGKAAINRSTA